jgi:hypothetical protein
MDHFICNFRGLPVRVWFQRTDANETFWIANVELEGVALSLDGTIFLCGELDQFEVTESVVRALQWAGDGYSRSIGGDS